MYRTTRKLTLTDAGAAYLLRVRAVRRVYDVGVAREQIEQALRDRRATAGASMKRHPSEFSQVRQKQGGCDVVP